MPTGGDNDMQPIEEAAEALLTIADATALQFRQLTVEQLNWKPSHDSWSVGQCFDHLITIQTLYFPQLMQLTNGQEKPSAWQRYSPFSSLFGRILIKSLQPDNPRKTKTASKPNDPSRAWPTPLRPGRTRHRSERFSEEQFQNGAAAKPSGGA